MRNKVAKALKRVVYGDDVTKSEYRKYLISGTITAEPKRQAYQYLKRRWNEFSGRERGRAKDFTKALRTSGPDVQQSIQA